MCLRNLDINAVATIGNHVEAKIMVAFLNHHPLSRCIGVADKEIDITCQTTRATDLAGRKQPVVGPAGQAGPMLDAT